MRYTHAIVVRIPSKIKFEDKKLAKSVDLVAARKEQEDLNETLREVCPLFGSLKGDTVTDNIVFFKTNY